MARRPQRGLVIQYSGGVRQLPTRVGEEATHHRGRWREKSLPSAAPRQGHFRHPEMKSIALRTFFDALQGSIVACSQRGKRLAKLCSQRLLLCGVDSRA